MGFVSQLVRRDAVSWLREGGKGYGSRSKFDRPHQQLLCQILPREASAVRLRSYRVPTNDPPIVVLSLAQGVHLDVKRPTLRSVQRG